MMQIVYFSQKEQFLTEVESLAGDKVYIAPSPAKADGLRTRLPTNSTYDVITIAKFTSNLVDSLWGKEIRPEVKRKSELLLIFGILKNKYLPDLGYEQFNQAYNLFSDLRSFTMNQEALASVLDEQPEIIKQAVLLFWKLLEVTGYLDEHGAYQQIAERLRSTEQHEELNKTFIFWGFQHLNGQQIDLLKALSIRYQVIIPFPLALKEKVKKSDWLSWVKDNKTEERSLENIPAAPKGSWLSINSREISLHLKGLIKSNDQIVLGVSKLTASDIDIVPSQEVKFKIPHQILTNELVEVADELKKFTGNHAELANVCLDQMRSPRSMKHLKAWQLYSDALSVVSSLTDELILVDTFFLKVLGEVVTLNQPRTSFVPVSPASLTIDLKDMSSLEDIDRRRRVILCIDERFEDIQGLGQNYTESIQKSLAALGPLKRNELELLFKQWEFRDLFSRANVIVLMNEGTLKHSLIWKRMFSEIELDKLNKEVKSAERILKDHFQYLQKKTFTGTYSASKLQTYLDCPRKFYFNYVDKVFPSILLEKDLDPMTSGTIIHEIIERYFKENLIDADLTALTKRVMQSYIAEKNLVLPKEVYLQRELIFNHRALNGIKFIREIEERTGEKIDWKIEESFHTEEGLILNGRIDCLGISSKYLFLLDFKSTEFSASSSTEVVNLDALQLWVYAFASKYMIKDFDKKSVVLGYVVLDDPAKSNLLTDDEELSIRIKESKFCKIHKLKDDFLAKLHEAQDKLVALSMAITSDTEFLARPRKNSTCDFCELNKVCVKSELSNVQVS